MKISGTHRKCTVLVFSFFFTFLDIYFSKCNVYLLYLHQTPPPFVMTQINEIKQNRLPIFFYAFPMSTANLHSSPSYNIRTSADPHFTPGPTFLSMQSTCGVLLLSEYRKSKLPRCTITQHV